MSPFIYEKDSDGIVTVTMDMSGPVNAMNAEYREAMSDTLARLESETGLAGVVLASAKKVFFAGGDINELLSLKPGEADRCMNEMIGPSKQQLRRLEKLPVPVVAAINGAALGGGFEICLSCNYRIAFNHPSVLIGLPEVDLGLLPGGGGIVRMVQLLGLEKALPYLLEGKKVNPVQAQSAGMIHETVDNIEDLVPRAKAYICENKNNPGAAVQPWDSENYQIPGGKAGSAELAQLIQSTPVDIQKKTRGLLPAPEQILDCAIEAARLEFDTAQIVESRGLTYLLMTPQAKNMMTHFFQMNQVKRGAGRPKDIESSKVSKVGILGAGMMGQGIAYVSAMAGIDVVLKDISMEAAEKGKSYTEKLLAKKVGRGQIDESKKAEVLQLIKPTACDEDLQGCDIIVEAVFENMDLKKDIIESIQGYLVDSGVWATNTSSLPITELACASHMPQNFIGLHFFSPVEKMPLVEIICGEKTSDDTLAKAFDYVRQIKKTAIVVNDSLAFFTSRTFSAYLDEGVRLLSEGQDPVKIDSLGKAIGMPLGPLAVFDEVSLELTRKMQETWAEMGVQDKWYEQVALRQVLDTMIGEYGRGGRHHGGGFYEYSQDRSKVIWPKLYDIYFQEDQAISEDDIKDRLMFRQVIESLRCLQSGVLRSVAEGNVGSILGIGAPMHTGGFIQFVNTYGLEAFMARCDELAERYGERFVTPEIVARKAAADELFV